MPNQGLVARPKPVMPRMLVVLMMTHLAILPDASYGAVSKCAQ